MDKNNPKNLHVPLKPVIAWCTSFGCSVMKTIHAREVYIYLLSVTHSIRRVSVIVRKFVYTALFVAFRRGRLLVFGVLENYKKEHKSGRVSGLGSKLLYSSIVSTEKWCM